MKLTSIKVKKILNKNRINGKIFGFIKLNLKYLYAFNAFNYLYAFLLINFIPKKIEIYLTNHIIYQEKLNEMENYKCPIKETQNESPSEEEAEKHLNFLYSQILKENNFYQNLIFQDVQECEAKKCKFLFFPHRSRKIFIRSRNLTRKRFFRRTLF